MKMKYDAYLLRTKHVWCLCCLRVDETERKEIWNFCAFVVIIMSLVWDFVWNIFMICTDYRTTHRRKVCNARGILWYTSSVISVPLFFEDTTKKSCHFLSIYMVFILNEFKVINDFFETFFGDYVHVMLWSV